MPTNSSTSLKNSGEKRNPFVEVSDAEKLLWARIHSKGVLDSEAKDLYYKACSIYEMLFLGDNELPDLQHIEYLLWRLHYKHIDEFRKRISQNSAEDDKQSTNRKATGTMVSRRLNTVNEHMEAFKLFLSEATEFYQELIRKIKRYYGLLEEPWFYKNDGVSGRIEQSKLHKCQFVCHRLCICLGDLARYLELYGKPDHEQRSWSGAASYYLEAAKIHPDSGNPHNQLAVLATYIADEFLALYHCIRSLAVRQPFPDAWQNLMLLFERNRSSNIASLSNGVYDSCKPSEWISIPSKEGADGICSNSTKAANSNQSLATDLWSLIIRTTSFFFLESRLDSFPSTFTSTLTELETLLALDVAKLSSALESFQNFNLSKAGPYRALHIVSVLLFIIHSLIDKTEHKIPKPANEVQQSMLLKLALTATFVCMGRFVDRCLMGSPVIYFPLLPALLVFVEWLVGAIDKVYIDDENCEAAICYFFTSFVELLNHLQEVAKDQVKFPDHVALWEDYELRGFIPLSHTHSSLDFSSHWEEEINYKMKNEYRAHRIIQAAMKIANKSGSDAQKWLFYAQDEKKFSSEGTNDSDEQKSCSVEEAKEPHQKHEKSTLVEEEEDIVFKPITRHNSEPIPLNGQTVASKTADESLRRASSVLAAQNRALINSLTSRCANHSASPNRHLGTSAEGPIAAGPPSLSSWVLNGDGLSVETAKSNETDKRVLKPIDEMASSDLGSLSLTKDESTGFFSSYHAPVPSAPLLRENSVWVAHTSTGFSNQNAVTQEPASFVPSSSMHFSSNPSGIFWPSPSALNLIDYSPSFLAPMESYPWSGPQFPKLGNHNLLRPLNAMQDQHYPPREPNGSRGSAALRFDLLDEWRYNPTVFPDRGPPLLRPSSQLLRGLYDQRTDMFFHDYQRPSPYVSQGMTSARPEPQTQPILQYLKQREWQFQPGPQFTGSPYTQN